MMKNKKIVTYSIDKKVLEKFNEIAKKLGSNKSQVVQILIQQWINKNDKDQDI